MWTNRYSLSKGILLLTQPTQLLKTIYYVYVLGFLFVCFLLCLSILPSCMYAHHLHGWRYWDPEEAIASLGTGVTDGCEPPCSFWENELICHHSIFQPVSCGIHFTAPSYRCVCLTSHYEACRLLCLRPVNRSCWFEVVAMWG